jgi:hypothetical protein
MSGDGEVVSDLVTFPLGEVSCLARARNPL